MRKFVDAVEQVTFSGPLAARKQQEVHYVTERCVFKLESQGLRLSEIAPGIDIERDILPHMGFSRDRRRQGNGRADLPPEPMGLRAEFLEAPLSERVAFDAESNRLSVNFRGYSLTDPSDLDHLEALVVQHCEGRPGKVDCIVWYDGFNIDPALESRYADSHRRS